MLLLAGQLKRTCTIRVGEKIFEVGGAAVGRQTDRQSHSGITQQWGGGAVPTSPGFLPTYQDGFATFSARWGRQEVSLLWVLFLAVTNLWQGFHSVSGCATGCATTMQGQCWGRCSKGGGVPSKARCREGSRQERVGGGTTGMGKASHSLSN